MHFLRRSVVPLLVGVLGCYLLLGVLVPNTAGLAIDPAFLLGLLRGAMGQFAGEPISLPPGFTASVYASGLNHPTALAVGPDGTLYVAQLGGEIYALPAGTPRLLASGFTAALGITWRGGELYVASRNRVSVLSPGGPVRDIITGLPAARHQTDNIVFGRDGRLYIGQGSRSDHGELVGIEPPEASILVADADGSNLRVFARGLRNPFGLAVFPPTGELFATDNGRDVPGSGVPDELNLIVDGGNYGWPDCYGRGLGANCDGTIFPIAEFQEHSSADGFAFYAGSNFPAEYQGNAFVALYGSNSGDPLIGRRVERIVLAKAPDGYHGTVTPFATGFKNPLDVKVGADGALYVADFGSGTIYRIIWK